VSIRSIGLLTANDFPSVVHEMMLAYSGQSRTCINFMRNLDFILHLCFLLCILSMFLLVGESSASSTKAAAAMLVAQMFESCGLVSFAKALQPSLEILIVLFPDCVRKKFVSIFIIVDTDVLSFSLLIMGLITIRVVERCQHRARSKKYYIYLCTQRKCHVFETKFIPKE